MWIYYCIYLCTYIPTGPTYVCTVSMYICMHCITYKHLPQIRHLNELDHLSGCTQLKYLQVDNNPGVESFKDFASLVQ